MHHFMRIGRKHNNTVGRHCRKFVSAIGKLDQGATLDGPFTTLVEIISEYTVQCQPVSEPEKYQQTTWMQWDANDFFCELAVELDGILPIIPDSDGPISTDSGNQSLLNTDIHSIDYIAVETSWQ